MTTVVLLSASSIGAGLPLIEGFNAAAGVLTAIGGGTPHAAVVARQMAKVCVVGCAALQIDEGGGRATLDGRAIGAGDWISIDGDRGEVTLGAERSSPPRRPASLRRWRGGGPACRLAARNASPRRPALISRIAKRPLRAFRDRHVASPPGLFLAFVGLFGLPELLARLLQEVLEIGALCRVGLDLELLAESFDVPPRDEPIHDLPSSDVRDTQCSPAPDARDCRSVANGGRNRLSSDNLGSVLDRQSQAARQAVRAGRQGMRVDRLEDTSGRRCPAYGRKPLHRTMVGGAFQLGLASPLPTTVIEIIVGSARTSLDARRARRRVRS